ncbi:MAG: hypothetical protein AAF547_03615 [Actinomycetota bacterium]
MAELLDARVPATQLFGPPAAELADAVVATGDERARIDLVAAWLTDRAPAEPTAGEALSDLVEAALSADGPVTRVDDLAAMAGLSPRTLQRRIQLAGEAARTGPRSWAEVANRLGYADQAHLTADMSRTFGAPPASYARDEAASD